MADLFPTDIDEEELSSLQPEENYDPFEEQSRLAIDQFFSSQEIVPSPDQPPSRVRSPVRGAEGVGANSGVHPGRELHTVTVCCQTALAALSEVDLDTAPGAYCTFHVARNGQPVREGITRRRSVRRRLFCSVTEEEEPTRESRGGQALSPIADDIREGPSSMAPPHVILHSSPITDRGVIRFRRSQGPESEGQISQVSPIIRLGTRSNVATPPSDQWRLSLPELDEHFLFGDRNVNERAFGSLLGFDSILDVREPENLIPLDISYLSPSSSGPTKRESAGARFSY
ncbi:hypothetical protein MTO96_018311 [Rhipicephalus appendiculatus]